MFYDQNIVICKLVFSFFLEVAKTVYLYLQDCCGQYDNKKGNINTSGIYSRFEYHIDKENIAFW